MGKFSQIEEILTDRSKICIKIFLTKFVLGFDFKITPFLHVHSLEESVLMCTHMYTFVHLSYMTLCTLWHVYTLIPQCTHTLKIENQKQSVPLNRRNFLENFPSFWESLKNLRDRKKILSDRRETYTKICFRQFWATLVFFIFR